ncbi:MAG: four helix bundle protein [Candidatus Marinimicrobia bacterium]|nr:four helix bundle protein [Candidatus Neomarinimicrobiota bacterium]
MRKKAKRIRWILLKTNLLKLLIFQLLKKNGGRKWKREGDSHFRELIVYQKAFEKAMEIFQMTKSFPSSEKYSSTDQIRRSSRSVCSNLAESWRKRRYQAVFVNKLTDSMQEAFETQTWLEFSLECNYITKEIFDNLNNEYEDIIKMLNSMEMNANKFCYKN